MLVSGGYPGDYAKGKIISGFEKIDKSLVFHAGTDFKDGDIITAGGRVIAVTTLARDIKTAIATSIESAAKISFGNSYFRRDIGFDL